MKMHFFTFFLLSFSYVLQGALTYVYPVTSFIDKNGQHVVMLVQQKGLGDLSLWLYNTQTGTMAKELYWHYIPAGIALLPDKQGFSFVDSGRLRIKLFAKRSPQSVEFPIPIHALGNVRWSDENTCYFSAKSSHQKFAIFFAKPRTHTPQITPICVQQKKDYLHPAVQQKRLFCIERSVDYSTMIIKKELDTAVAPTVPLVATGYQQICFLEMIDANRGWYIEHMPYLDKQLEMVSFIVHYFFQVNDLWQEQKLFSFKIPSRLLLGDERLYESFLAIRPRFYHEAFYYCDAKENTHLLSKKYLLNSFSTLELALNKPAMHIRHSNLLSLLPTAHGLYGGFYMDGDAASTDLTPLFGAI